MSHRAVLTLISLLVLMAMAAPALPGASDYAPVTVCFTPGGNCTDVIVQARGRAKRTILAHAYSFTSAPITKALLDAHQRGVQVQVIRGKSQRLEKYSSADFLANQGVPDDDRRHSCHCA